MQYGKKGLKYLQRVGVTLTHVGPHPRIMPKGLAVHQAKNLVLSQPYPQPEVQVAELGIRKTPTSIGQNQPWPRYT